MSVFTVTYGPIDTKAATLRYCAKEMIKLALMVSLASLFWWSKVPKTFGEDLYMSIFMTQCGPDVLSYLRRSFWYLLLKLFTYFIIHLKLCFLIVFPNSERLVPLFLRCLELGSSDLKTVACSAIYALLYNNQKVN